MTLNSFIKFLIIFLMLILICTRSFSDILSESGSFLSANTIEHHKELSMISAIGDVEVINEEEILRANKITYDLENDTILAQGKVSLQTKGGDILYADVMELKGDLKKGIVKNFTSVLSDGSIISAAVINRDAEKGDTLEKVIYTKCEPCEDNSEEYPIWQIKALKSKRNLEEGRIEYDHVILDAYGFPVFYLPTLSHADPSLKRSSGFLSPKFKNNSILGPTYTQPYYYVLSDYSDITFSPAITFNEGPILGAKYRKLRSKGSTFINGSFTRGSMERGSGAKKFSNRIRGHININAAERINKKWVSGINFIRATDATYLPRYGMENVGSGTLTQRAHITGYERGFYGEIEGLYFQPMDASKSNRHVPLIFPNAKATWTQMDKEGFFRVITFNTTSIARASGSNSQRISLDSRWIKEKILDSGNVIKTSLSGRADLYRDRKTDHSVTSGDFGSNKNIRLIPKLETSWSLPSKGDFLDQSILFEPIIQGVLSPPGGNPNSIINNDSMDIELNYANLFSDRFTGLDRIESGSRINFGFRTIIDFDDYGELNTLMGRAWRLEKPQKDFTKGTGLSKKLSNVVGIISYGIRENLKLDYSFRRDSFDFKSQRDTISLDMNNSRMSTNLSYTMVKDDPNPTAPTSSEQAVASMNLAISNNWSTNVMQSRDFVGSTFGDAIFSRAGLKYLDECIQIEIYAQRQHRDTVDVPDTTTYSVAFKLLGF